ncbi:SDR family oxidoreductase [Microbacterium sp. P26]|uniref:SDR family NAD(P)-dependent oxidoreductase n=1 Tax=Microbacterium TaxID=33882 RepID=UPI00203F72D5|nr:SDR family oxidoreductase [Microbacterium sp. P26]MCM3503173.1 SDR family oxidoreductase [Microbacterium sp. P26]
MARQDHTHPSRISVVTGAASGIGAALATALAERGHRVVVSDIDPDAAATVAREIGGRAFACDVADPDQVDALAAFTLAEYGGVDDLFNNAGVGSHGRVDEMTRDDWAWMLGVNLYGVINGVTSFLPALRRSAAGGRIVNTCSMSAVAPLVGLGAYATAKAGVLALTEVLSAEMEGQPDAVTVSAVLAGPTRTRISTSARHRGDTGPSGLADVELSGPIVAHMIEPDEAAARILEGADAGQLFIVTHPALGFRASERAKRILASFSSA